MRVAPRRYGFCYECSTITDEEVNHAQTVQWLYDVQIPRTRSSWGPRHPSLTYVCTECGTKNHGP